FVEMPDSYRCGAFHCRGANTSARALGNNAKICSDACRIFTDFRPEVGHSGKLADTRQLDFYLVMKLTPHLKSRTRKAEHRRIQCHPCVRNRQRHVEQFAQPIMESVECGHLHRVPIEP